jgi:hypothetical protein
VAPLALHGPHIGSVSQHVGRQNGDRRPKLGRHCGGRGYRDGGGHLANCSSHRDVRWRGATPDRVPRRRDAPTKPESGPGPSRVLVGPETSLR